MRILTLALAGTLIATAGLTATAAAAQGATMGESTRGSHRASSLPPGSLSESRVRQHRGSPQISPHIGLPGFSGFPSSSPQISPHIGLPGISGLTAPSTSSGRDRHRRGHGRDRDGEFIGYLDYAGDGDGYVDRNTLPDEFGFFWEGGEVTLERDRPVYHYDRGYPYEFYSGRAPTSAPTAAAGLHCQVRQVPSESERRNVMVRVCSAY